MFQIQPAVPEAWNRSDPMPIRSALFFNPFGCFALRFPVGPFRISLVRSERDTNAPALRNFDTEPRSPYCYEVYSDNRLESVANAHTAADLHVRPVS